MKTVEQQILAGDQQAIARLITAVENNSPVAIDVMRSLHRHTGHAHIIGVTGVMGGGKSSLIYKLSSVMRKKGLKIGIIAIDPTSPFTGGALLGDRIRMGELSDDPDVFIRSMGTRGMLGGLSGAVYDVIEILDAAGKDVILIETVGVGQAEVDIVKVADTTIVLLVPGLGDSIQTIKAGLMEIADIFVVNKADKPGADQTVAELESFLDVYAPTVSQRKPVIVSTSVKENMGFEDLHEQIQLHYMFLQKNEKVVEKRKIRYEVVLVEIIRKRLMGLIYDQKRLTQTVDQLVSDVVQRKLDPYTAADTIFSSLIK
ncbi:MAG: methylmalonyl Co-A mutase-associated GTPase MeaB [Candidatus Thermoplasmatota archaeon]|nr:methylmalonyl Co-A mutase-associated GTPase MeaB [Candidatus Thermoplasmatota archaeon]MBU1941005.1 methylmalonyl Co-A mutase-associated GTPase MeaB [Candidatus Thermoplasmatota archaeon]